MTGKAKYQGYQYIEKDRLIDMEGSINLYVYKQSRWELLSSNPKGHLAERKVRAGRKLVILTESGLVANHPITLDYVP